jgi:hypothetical protein
MHKVETQHLELQDSHSTWLHTAEDQHKVTDNLVQMERELKIEQELAQEEAAKVTGRTHGAAEAAEAELEALESTLIYSSITLEDTLDTMEDQEAHQKVHQVVDQVQLTQMTLEEDLLEDVEVQAFMELQAAEADLLEVLADQEQTVEDKASEIISEPLVQMEEQILVQAVVAAEETLLAQESAKLPIG